MNIGKRKQLLLLSLIFLLVFVFTDMVFARAGGGGGGRGGGIAGLILLPFFIIYSIILTYFLKKKNKEANALIGKIEKYDKFWDMDTIKKRVEQTYFKVQQAWMGRDQDIAKDYMSEALYQKHKMQTDAMIANHEKNVLERINLKDARIVEILDYKDDARDRMWVYIRGSMIDYTINDQTGKVKSGNDNEPEGFAELWKFIRYPHAWVLDEIDQTVTISELAGFVSYSEESA
jgi:hypothetical protein